LAGERRSGKRAASAIDRVRAWAEGYETLGGIPDEFIGRDGAPRPHWLHFLDALARLGQEEIDQRFAAADRYIRDMAMSYRVLGEANERSWPLSRLPLLIPEAEWREISAGVVQRAELAERVLADLYGDGRLVAEGVLPAAAVAGSPDFLLPMRGAAPPGGRWLSLYAADIGRGPDGRWWVLGDRTQAPSGSGYALENRLVISRAIPGLYRQLNVLRLAPFFREFRAGLAAAAERSEPRLCLLTPGPWSETYFEQAYLARYLGLLLVEGEDLVTSEGRIHVRTIAGLKRADVIWRRVDGDWCDPLELNAASRIGVPGMVEAIRGGAVAIANLPGAGLIESRALLGFMPTLARHLLGEKLRLPNIATWWCGQASERDEVLESLDEMAISGAFTATVPGFADKRIVIGAELEPPERRRLAAAIGDRGIDYVGQEIVRLSTTPLWQDGRLVPRPFVLRVFAAWTPEGWRAMPGGFCRISDRPDARAVSMGAGVQSADVWVLAKEPVEMATLLPSGDKVKIVRLLGNLPSRAADNLFWLGRYLERAEATLRLVRCLSGRIMDAETPSRSARQSIDHLKQLLGAWGAVATPAADLSATEVAFTALRDEQNYGSALAIARAARHAASAIRERLSQDAWHLLGLLETRLGAEWPAIATEPQTLERTVAALHTLAAISGLLGENFNRVAGWSFLDIGRRIERGIDTCRFARQFADREATAENLDVLLDLIDSQITYRSRYLIGVALAPVRDMALLDPFNPRSVGFQVARIDDHLAGLPSLGQDGMLEAPRKIALELRTDLAIADAEGIDAGKILGFEQRLTSLADAIAVLYFPHGPNALHSEGFTGLA
jgi:uncharacterized circularly permuted ATP-grasp superfamily protein/uncharacterized alpha-E superfamily protein